MKIRRSGERNQLQPEAPCFPKADPSHHDNLVLPLRGALGQLDLSISMGDSGGTAGAGGKDGGGAQVPMEDILGALALFMEQHRANQGGQGATKALKSVVSNVGRFDGKNISKFLRVYICEMEVHQVGENRMSKTFDMAVVPDIRERVQEIRE